MPIYVPGKVVLAQTYVGIDDPDAAAYITAVNAADAAAGQTGGLETAVQVAIHSFVKGCKNDGIWPAIKASCILAGARTRLGALTPLVGPIPTSFNFVDGDYNRETGLIGNGSNRYLSSAYTVPSSLQNNVHASVYVGTVPTGGANRIALGNGDGTGLGFYARSAGTGYFFACNTASATVVSATVSTTTGLIAVSRDSGVSYSPRINGVTSTVTQASAAPINNAVNIYAGNPAGFYSDARLAFYSIGESLNLALLDARVTALITAIGAAI